MNERIRELAERAQKDGDSIHYYSPAFAQKFAELIVLECAKLMANEKAYYDNPGSYETGDYYKRCAAKADAFDSAVSIIKNHFGVE